MTYVWDRALTEALEVALKDIKGDVLDLGCGHKPYHSMVGSRATQWIGFDHPSTRDDRDNLQDVSGDAAYLPFASQSFDAVVSTQVLEHCPRPHLVFGEMSRVLKPGGTAVVSVPQQVDSLHEEPYDFFRYTKYGLKILSEDAGLHVIDTMQLGGSIRLVAELTLRHSGPLNRFPRLIKNIGRVVGPLEDLIGPRFSGTTKAAMGWVLIATKPI